MRRLMFLITAALVGTGFLFTAAWRGSAQLGGPPRQTSLVLGQALPGLTEQQEEEFGEGLKAFSETETRGAGLGPVFNGTTCAECHKAGATGGAGTDLTISRVTRIGGLRNGQYDDLAAFGGPVLQARSLLEFDTSCPVPGEVVPPQAMFVSRRITTPLFGAGLIEAIPDAAILAQVGRPDPDGVRGMANMVYNPETHRKEVGRFGWKAQHSSLHMFAGDAYLNEMGITSLSFPFDNLPQGRPIPPGWDVKADPEDNDGDTEKFTSFMRLLAPPGRRLPVSPDAQNGERLFQFIRCSSCHTPSLRSGPNAIAALANQTVPLYSDLLLHRMGNGLADGIRQSDAVGDQFKTAPLWGLSRRSFFLHDGRARSIEEAVALHGGEAAPAAGRFMRLNGRDRGSILAFLNSL